MGTLVLARHVPTCQMPAACEQVCRAPAVKRQPVSAIAAAALLQTMLIGPASGPERPTASQTSAADACERPSPTPRARFEKLVVYTISLASSDDVHCLEYICSFQLVTSQ